MQSKSNTMITAFRASRKTTIARGYVVWCIIHKTEPHIVVQSYEDTLSSERVREVAKMLFKKKIIQDYWLLFPLETKKEDLKKKSLSNFETTNGVKISSKSLGQTLRGANTFSMEDEKSARPTLLILDDIDVSKSVENTDIIEKNYNKITGETISALDPLQRKIIFLWNVINEDWVVPRFHVKYKDTRSRNCFWQPLYVDNENQRPEVFTDDVVNTIKDDWEVSYNQNYLLIAYKDGQSIIKRSQIQVLDNEPEWCKYVIGIDPAFSLKTNTDDLAIVITAHKEGKKYIIQAIPLQGLEKDEENVKKEIRKLYDRYNISIVNVESNNGGEIIARQLRNNNIAVQILNSTKDKVTRLREHEGEFTRGDIFFIKWTEKLQDQLLLFPSKAKDDLVDAMVFSFKFQQSLSLTFW